MSSEMQNVLVYLTAFFMVFLSFVVFSLCLRVLLWIYMQYYNRQRPRRTGRPSDVNDTAHLPGHRCQMHLGSDRQGNIFTIPDESANNNSLQHRCPDFFYVEPSAEDAARIRAQLEKDEKDLPTYEEVMAMSLAQAQAGSMAPHNESNTSIAATTHIPVPPYSEINTNVSHPAPQLPSVVTNSTIPPPHSGGATVWPMLTSPVGSSGDASTSRAAAAAATTTSTTVTIANSMSNTSV